MSIFDGAEIIYAYTRAEALADGVLVDATSTAEEAGFTIPVALTRAAWEECVTWDPDHGQWQDEAGRLWDVCWMAFCAARLRPGRDRVTFHVLRVPNRPRTRIARGVALVAHVGPGDTADPVVTIMLPGES